MLDTAEMDTKRSETSQKRNFLPHKRGARVLRHPARGRVAVLSTEAEPREAAASAGLRYVTDRIPGLRRLRVGKGFRFVTPRGTTVRGKDLERIHALAIPPAWKDVWVCPDARGHLQATGRDARGRKQHRYHPRWRKVRDEAKYGRILEFAAALPALRKRANTDLSGNALSRRKVVAAVVQLLERTLIRVGNDEYARDNQSFGLTTMRDTHAHVTRSTIRFRFKGKSGKFHDIAFADARLARIVRRCQELPGRELFQYLDDDGKVQDVGSADVNDYLREVTGRDFTAKDFRTWIGTVLAARALHEMKEFASDAQAKRNVLTAVEAVAEMLGNTRAVCRKCYIHPAIIDSYLDRSLAQTLSARAGARLAQSPNSLNRTETAVLALLQRRLRRDAQRKSA
jgi:DNA topoisomerase I